MQDKIMYIELKTGHSNNGPAWIGKVQFSKSGRTVYFNGKAFKNIGGSGVQGNYLDIESQEEYWISGVKKNGQDRHSDGAGRIKLDRSSVDEYLALVDCDRIDEKHFEMVDIQPTDKQKFTAFENATLNP